MYEGSAAANAVLDPGESSTEPTCQTHPSYGGTKDRTPSGRSLGMVVCIALVVEPTFCHSVED